MATERMRRLGLLLSCFLEDTDGWCDPGGGPGFFCLSWRKRIGKHFSFGYAEFKAFVIPARVGIQKED